MPTITEGILPILLTPGLDESQWEFGFYKLSSIDEVFDIDRVLNWQNAQTFHGISDGYYFAVARMKDRPNVFDFRKEQISCNAGTCTLRVLAVTKTASASSCTLRIIAVTKVRSGGGGQGEPFSGFVLLGRNI